MNTNVDMIMRGHANCYILEEDGLVLIDTGMHWKEDALRKEFVSRKLNPQDVRLIIITHGHSDHFGGLQTCLDLCGNPPVLCHKKAAVALESGRSAVVTPRNALGTIVSLLGCFTSQTKVRVKPSVTISEETDLSPYGISGKIIPTPGHTLCSLSVLLEDGSVILGDTVMPGAMGSPGLPFFADDMNLLKESYKILEHLITGPCFTGHGGPFTADDVIAMMHHHVHINP